MIGTEQGSSLQSLTVAGLSAHWAAIPDDGDIQSYQKKLDPQDQCYSSMLSDYDFIRMGIAILFNCPEAKDKKAAFFTESIILLSSKTFLTGKFLKPE